MTPAVANKRRNLLTSRCLARGVPPSESGKEGGKYRAQELSGPCGDVQRLDTMVSLENATFAVAKRKPKKNSGLYGIRTLDLCDNGAALYQLG